MSNIYRLFQAVFGAFVVYFLAGLGFQDQQLILISIITFLVILWTNEALPLGVVSLLPIIIFPIFGILNTVEITAVYSKPIIFLFLGGFLIGLAVEKVNLHRAIISRMFLIFPYTPRGTIFSLTATSAVLSSILSNTTTSLLLMPLALAISPLSSLRMRFVLAIAYGATVGGILTPVGTPPNLIFLGFLEQNNLQTIPFLQWVLLCLPLAAIMLISLSLVLSFGLNNISLNQALPEPQTLNREQKKLSFILILLGLTLLLNSPIEPYYSGLGINEKLLLLGFGLLMFVPGSNFLRWEDTRKTPYEILFLFGAGFGIAASVQNTGLDMTIAQYLLSFSNWPAWLLILCIASLVTFSTEITSNMALTTVAIPIIFSLCQMTGLNPYLYMMVATICASYAFMLPIATAPNAIAMASGAVRVREMARYGFLLNCIAILLTTVMANIIWRVFL
tara:strand:- start:465 stop:1808 length:1344 start_codon:yes stop_codon:yes gene_type:complete